MQHFVVAFSTQCVWNYCQQTNQCLYGAAGHIGVGVVGEKINDKSCYPITNVVGYDGIEDKYMNENFRCNGKQLHIAIAYNLWRKIMDFKLWTKQITTIMIST